LSCGEGEKREEIIRRTLAEGKKERKGEDRGRKGPRVPSRGEKGNNPYYHTLVRLGKGKGKRVGGGGRRPKYLFDGDVGTGSYPS